MEQPLPRDATELVWEEARECGACGSRASLSAGLVGRRRYVTCAECRVERLQDRVAEDQLGLLYSNYYVPDDLSPAELEHQLANPTFGHRHRRLEACLGSRTRRLLEIGCGDGNFLASVRRAGWEVEGQEVSADTAAIVERRHGIKIFVGTLEAISAARPFPVVAAYHVFEHVYRPAEWLRRARQLLEPKGLLHLQVPNGASLTRRACGNLWASLRFPRHVYFYDPGTLQALLSRFGFTVLTTTTWDPWHGPGSVAESMGNVVLRVVKGRELWSEASVPGVQSPAAALPPRRHPMKAIARRGLHAAAEVLARAEALAGRGAVVDIIASKD